MIKPDADSAPKLRQLGETFSRRRLGKRLLQSELVQRTGSALIGWTLGSIWRSNRDNGTSTDWETMLDGEWPAIFALWHGQHLLVPYASPSDRNVVMIADISKGQPRQAGEGIVTLAKISGRPIVPVALATSRRRVLEKTWDKTTINLPFGTRSVRLAPPIYVTPKADEQEMADARLKVTAELNRVTEEAMRAVEAGT